MKAVLCLLFASLVTSAQAGADHAHGDSPQAMATDAPRRLPSGDVFLAKPTQRKLGIRTSQVTTAEHARAFELNGRVISDPNAGGRVQSTQAGRLLPGPGRVG